MFIIVARGRSGVFLGNFPNFEHLLEVLRRIKRRQLMIRLKSGLMLSRGETNE